MSGFELSLDMCLKMTKAAEEAQQEIGVCVSLAIADCNGNLRFFYRFGNAIHPSIEISQKKAYTSAVLNSSTSEFGKIAQPGGSAFGINIACPNLVVFGGGLPLQKDGKNYGGIGVSGASADEDEFIASRMLEVFARE